MLYLWWQIFASLLLAVVLGFFIGWLIWGRHLMGLSGGNVQARRVNKTALSEEDEEELERLRNELEETRRRRDELEVRNDGLRQQLQDGGSTATAGMVAGSALMAAGSAGADQDLDDEALALRRQNDEYAREISTLRAQIGEHDEFASHDSSDMYDDDLETLDAPADTISSPPAVAAVDERMTSASSALDDAMGDFMDDIDHEDDARGGANRIAGDQNDAPLEEPSEEPLSDYDLFSEGKRGEDERDRDEHDESEYNRALSNAEALPDAGSDAGDVEAYADEAAEHPKTRAQSDLDSDIESAGATDWEPEEESVLDEFVQNTGQHDLRTNENEFEDDDIPVITSFADRPDDGAGRQTKSSFGTRERIEPVLQRLDDESIDESIDSEPAGREQRSDESDDVAATAMPDEVDGDEFELPSYESFTPDEALARDALDDSIGDLMESDVEPTPPSAHASPRIEQPSLEEVDALDQPEHAHYEPEQAAESDSLPSQQELVESESTGGISRETAKPGVAPELLDEPVGAPDDLKKISGVGPKLERTLNDVGIFHFWQIAELTQDEVDWLNSQMAFPRRIERENWIAQSNELASGKQTEFSLRYSDSDS